MPGFDVITIGAGPAGITASYELSKKGIRVLLLEKDPFPRYKPCGGGLSLKIENVIDFSIKEVIEKTINGTYFTFKQKEGLYLLSERPVAYMVMRDRFDSLLLSKAVKEGVHFLDRSQVKGLEQVKDGYEVFTRKERFKGKYIIGADGVNGVVRRYLHPISNRILAASIEAEIPVSEETVNRFKDFVHIDFGVIPYGYGWIFPKNGKLSAGIAGFKGIVKHPRRYFNRFIESHPLIQEFYTDNSRGYPIPLFGRPDPLTRDGIVLAGDAGNLVDPFFGEGIYYAMRSGQIAASVIYKAIKTDSINLTEYDKIIKEEFYTQFKAAQRISQFVYTFPRMWYDILSEQPQLAEKYYNVLRGERKYTEFLKDLRAIAGSLMKMALKKSIFQLFK